MKYTLSTLGKLKVQKKHWIHILLGRIFGVLVEDGNKLFSYREDRSICLNDEKLRSICLNDEILVQDFKNHYHKLYYFDHGLYAFNRDKNLGINKDGILISNSLDCWLRSLNLH